MKDSAEIRSRLQYLEISIEFFKNWLVRQTTPCPKELYTEMWLLGVLKKSKKNVIRVYANEESIKRILKLREIEKIKLEKML